MRISGIAVVSSIAIPETVSLLSFQFQVSHNTNTDVGAYWRCHRDNESVNAELLMTRRSLVSTVKCQLIAIEHWANGKTGHVTYVAALQ